MTDAGPIALASDFPVPTTQAWLALVEKTLGRGLADESDLRASIGSRIDDDFSIDPLYFPQNSAAPIALRRAEAADRDRPWDLRALIYDPDPAHANAFAREDLNGGATSLTVAIDLGVANGLGVASRDELARVLDGVLLDIAPVGLDAGFLGAEAAAWLGDLAKGAPAAPLAFNLDPLGAFSCWGSSPGPMAARIDADVRVATELAEAYPKASLFMASGLPVHEASGSIGQELGLALACALAYAKALAAAGMPLQQAFERIVLCLAADADYFTTLAKFRAGRLLMTRMAAACGVDFTPRIEARSSRRMLSRVDAWPNLLRLASACTGAALGGADIVQLAPFTFQATYAMKGRSSPLARRQARNIQLVLMEESGLGRVGDPAEGSWFLDSLTDTLARWGWSYFQAIEELGGALEALKQDGLRQRVDATFRRRSRDLAHRNTRQIGMTDFIDLDSVAAEVEPWGTTLSFKRIPNFKPRPEDDRGTCFPAYVLDLRVGFQDRHARAGSPKVYLATLGEAAAVSARTEFARNLVAIGDFRTLVGAVEAYDPALAPLAILCGSDEAYAAEARSAAAALKAAGAKRVLLVGQPAEREDELRAAGVDDFIFDGCDVVKPIHRMLGTLEGLPAMLMT